jgi:Protein of unknown function (DUF1572)
VLLALRTPHRADLWRTLETTVHDVDRVLAGLDETSLLSRRTIRDLDVSVLEAISHSVHHFGEHTGQIITITKLRIGRGLGLMNRRTIPVSSGPNRG